MGEVVRGLNAADLGSAPDLLTPEPRVGLFIHGEKLFAAINRMRLTEQGKALDFSKLLDFVRGGKKHLVERDYYCVAATACRPGQGEFLHKLRGLGFRTVVVPGEGSAKDRRSSFPIYKTIGNYVLKTLTRYDEVVIVGGTDGFIRPVEKILGAGKKITIISDAPNVSSDLRGTGAQIVMLEEVLPQVLMDIEPRKKVQSAATIFPTHPQLNPGV